MGNKSNQAKREKRMRERKVDVEKYPLAKRWKNARDVASAGQLRAVPKRSTWTGVQRRSASPLVTVKDARGRQHKERLRLPLAKVKKSDAKRSR